uniref:Uncharacterized protein n=1 Tax=Magallana gigas TaxID=29159 RepID=A0A8W8IEQ1_MAGGI
MLDYSLVPLDESHDTGICSFLTVAEEYTRIHSPHHSRELCRIGSLNLVMLPGHGPQRIAGQRSVYELSLGPLMQPWIC